MSAEARRRMAAAKAPITRHIAAIVPGTEPGKPSPVMAGWDANSREFVVNIVIAFTEETGLVLGADGKRLAAGFPIEIARIPYEVALAAVDRAKGVAASEQSAVERRD